MDSDIEELTTKIVRETAKIPWQELLRFFAGGYAIEVQRPQDLVKVAELFATDNASALKELMEQDIVRPVPDNRAQSWLEDDTVVWAVVVAPWVLVQAS